MAHLPVSQVFIASLLACSFLGTAAQAQTASTLDKVKAAGFITVAYREASIPFSYLADGQNPTGFAWEICGRIVDEVKKATGRADLQVKTQSVTSANRVPLLQNGTIDIECGSTTNNSERGKQVQFATNYFYTGTRYLVKAGSPIKSLADLKGKKVVSTTGTTNILVMRNVNRDKALDIDIMSAKDHAESALLVESGRADAFAMDDILLYGIKANAVNPASLAVVGEALQVEPYAIMLRRDDPAFKTLVDGTIATLIKSGDFQKLYTKWFQSPIPPKGVNLNAPMSDELKANLTALSDKPAL
ncbi:transporter substrate-binding domain-containing protein [Xylophilus sp. Kf1]|nr:transporter substrate-binding domain-containing protein [Xylophilus sp. Kf1]